MSRSEWDCVEWLCFIINTRTETMSSEFIGGRRFAMVGLLVGESRDLANVS